MNISGFDIPSSIQIHGTTLRLNGAAMRNKFFINIYIVAFYTTQSIISGEEAVHSRSERSLRMIVTTPLATPKLVSDNVVESLRETMGRRFHEMKAVVERIKAVIDSAQVGYRDCMDIFYSADGSLHVYKNGQYIGGESNAQVFAEALFSIYMGRQPVDGKVKKALLKGWG